jgi:hypothetical protein
MLTCYIVVIILNFLFRFSRLDHHGACVIGMKSFAVNALLGFDVVANVSRKRQYLVHLLALINVH